MAIKNRESCRLDWIGIPGTKADDILFEAGMPIQLSLFIRLSRLTDANYTIRYEYACKTSSQFIEYHVYHFPIKRLPLTELSV